MPNYLITYSTTTKEYATDIARDLLFKDLAIRAEIHGSTLLHKDDTPYTMTMHWITELLIPSDKLSEVRKVLSNYDISEEILIREAIELLKEEA